LGIGIAMTPEDLQQAIEKLQNRQNNIKIFTAVPMGVLLLLYFFSFASLIDHGLTGFLLFEIVTSVLFVLAFIFLNSLSFYLLRFFARHSPQREIMQQLTPEKIVQPAEQLTKTIEVQT
jgi:hypothetical protein